jgi:diguanylate cyclase (GGDEF)-like protein
MGESHTWERRTGRALKAFRLDSIRNKIVALALVATLVPTLATLAVFYVQNERALSEKIDGELRSVGSQAARELDIFFRGKRQDIGVFVSSFEVSENLQRIESRDPGSAEAVSRVTDYLTAIRNRFPDYTRLVLLDDQGELVASSGGTRERLTLPGIWTNGLRAGEAQVGDPFWMPGRGSVGVHIAQPITRDPAGEHYLGALVAELDVGAIPALMVGYAPGDGQVQVVTAGGTVIATSRGVPEELTARIDAPALEVLTSAPSATVQYRAADGQEVLGTLNALSGLPWAVVSEVSLGEAYEPIRRLRNLALLLVSALVAIVSLIAWFLGQVIARPLARLTDGAAEVAAGDFSVDLPVIGGGEVGYLTEVFNNMVGRLRRGREALHRASEELRERNVELERLSVTDGLTELMNRRKAMEVLEEEIERADRMNHPLGLLMLDVDHFKQYNDRWGHLEGDAVLKAVAAAIRDATRGIDTVARYGGEEFMVLLPRCDAKGGEEASTRILSHLAVEEFKGGPVTMSIGIASFPVHGNGPDGLIRAADDALYRAKEQGRNRYVVADSRVLTTAQSERGKSKRRKGSKEKGTKGPKTA